ncbi:hypothetical protein JVU11DRAFT_6721 [Chiua virens]|nr:hypothetical protein JVU11DRAFT_6721 [Chiua virens]
MMDTGLYRNTRCGEDPVLGAAAAHREKTFAPPIGPLYGWSRSLTSAKSGYRDHIILEDAANTLASLKRRIAHLEEQNHELRGVYKVRRNRESYRIAGRGIRRLVALSGKVEAIVDEHDRRTLDGADPAQSTPQQNQLHRSYKELVRWVPSIQRLLNSQADEFELRDAFKEVSLRFQATDIWNAGQQFHPTS